MQNGLDAWFLKKIQIFYVEPHMNQKYFGNMFQTHSSVGYDLYPHFEKIAQLLIGIGEKNDKMYTCIF